jgi:hypothetical protein
MPTYDRGELVLSTGTRVSAVSGIIGIDDDLGLYSGHDASIEVVDWLDQCVILSHAERGELASHAISLWTKFAALTDEELLSTRT